jgi:3'-phosphoadenosine 5'-phosphosulfate sulfotransferase (PAPS reductase)/FAD synthetase
MAIANQPRFLDGPSLFITGERAQESPARAKYLPFEPHRTHTKTRKIDHWRAIHTWTEETVWELIRHHRVNPHPAYKLGWGRVSCAACIFGSDDQWASLYSVNPSQIERIAAYEQTFGSTIHRSYPVMERVQRGTPYPHMRPADIQTALSPQYIQPAILPEDIPWFLPKGAFGDANGPT